MWRGGGEHSDDIHVIAGEGRASGNSRLKERLHELSGGEDPGMDEAMGCHQKALHTLVQR